jgi:hypothetical protein
MSTIDLTHRNVHGEQDPASAAIRRIGQIAGVLTIAVVIFTSLYFFTLYIAS